MVGKHLRAVIFELWRVFRVIWREGAHLRHATRRAAAVVRKCFSCAHNELLDVNNYPSSSWQCVPLLQSNPYTVPLKVCQR